MSANATQVLDGIEANLVSLYSTIPVRKRKGMPNDSPGSPLCGWTAGDPSPCFIVTCPDPEPIDEFGSFETICVKYQVVVAYVKPIAGGQSPREDDDDIRQKRQDIRDFLYKPTLAGTGQLVFGVGCKSLAPYTPGAGGTGSAMSVSAEVFECFTNEPRGFN